MDKRNKKENAPNFSSNSDDSSESDEALLEGSLNKDDYEKLLKLWPRKGAANWARKQKTFCQSWRAEFSANLKNDNDLWRQMIRDQAGGYRSEVRKLLDDAAGDPLMFLNLLGVSPFNVLYALEFQRDVEKAQEALRPFTPEVLKSDVRSFKKCARRLRLYERAFPDAMYEAYRSLPPSAGSASLRAAAKAIGDPNSTAIKDLLYANKKRKKSSDGETPMANRNQTTRGARTKSLLRSTINSLVIACESPLIEKFGKTAGRRIMWTTITTILMCAQKKDDVSWCEKDDELKRFRRKVKDGYRLWLKEHEPITGSELRKFYRFLVAEQQQQFTEKTAAKSSL